MSAHDNARELAQALLNSGKPSDEYSFEVTVGQDQQTDEEIHIYVVKHKKIVRGRVVKLGRALEEVAFFGPGSICARCNGSGRV
jgi:hypothetical protein